MLATWALAHLPPSIANQPHAIGDGDDLAGHLNQHVGLFFE
jgi:hypothetical protein